MTVPKGSIYGFVGENGAGKTTMMKMILGLEKPDHGDIFVNGLKVNYGENKTNRYIGYLPDVPVFYDYMTAKEYLQLCAEITAIPAQQRQHKIATILQLVNLKSTKRIQTFSRGMKQRLGIAQALLNEPSLLLCDEPTSALDPEGRYEFLQLLKRLQGQMTIVFSTHILSDVQTTCDQVGILHHGQIQVQGTLAQLEQSYFKPQIRLSFATPEAAQTGQRLLMPTFKSSLQENELTVVYQGNYQSASQEILTRLLAQHAVPVGFQQVMPTLEQIFLKVTQS